jgi:hypothetical protein
MDESRKNNNRLVLLMIAGIPLTMILMASWLWYFVVRGDLDLVGMLGTANRGTLVEPPRQLDDVDLFEQTGAPIKYADLERRWTMLVPQGAGGCDKACEERLYLTRQIHIAMGKEFNRLRRLFVSEEPVADIDLAFTELSDDRPAPPDFARLLADQHRGLKALRLETGAYERLFAEHAADPTTWYLVDPAGWIMMSYNGEVSYKDVIADLKFLLKNSSE